MSTFEHTDSDGDRLRVTRFQENGQDRVMVTVMDSCDGWAAVTMSPAEAHKVGQALMEVSPRDGVVKTIQDHGTHAARTGLSQDECPFGPTDPGRAIWLKAFNDHRSQEG